MAIVCRLKRIISIHAPPRGATRSARNAAQNILFQFTPLREGRPRSPAVSTVLFKISIHAPPRGATGDDGQQIAVVDISIHAPPRGATGTASVAVPFFLFQFTPLREGRLRLLLASACVDCISIHAPPRGATRVSCTCALLAGYFNSRPSARGDRKVCYTMLIDEFQFTPLREGRQFQQFRATFQGISIHAPPRGATARDLIISSSSSISIHAPPRGATCAGGTLARQSAISIHAPPRGATKGKGAGCVVTLFQFTPLREGRRHLC